VFFIVFLIESIRKGSKKLKFYVKKKKHQEIKKYILMVVNAPFLFFIFAYIYFLVLFSNKLPDFVILNFSIVIFIVYSMVQKKVKFIPRKFNYFIIISNIPIFLILNYSSKIDISSETHFFDFLFIYLNISKIYLFIYEFVSKKKSLYLEFLKQKYK
jgi:hypothetical protein